jgi:hypothetical protein
VAWGFRLSALFEGATDSTIRCEYKGRVLRRLVWAHAVEKLRHTKIGPEIWNIARAADIIANFVCQNEFSQEEILIALPVRTSTGVFH